MTDTTRPLNTRPTMPMTPHATHALHRLAQSLTLTAALTLTAHATTTEPAEAAPYQPRAVQVVTTQPYVTRDGAVAIYGNDGLADVIAAFNRLFTRTHPNVRFVTTMEGSSTGMPALAADATAFAPLTRDMWPGDRAAFRQIHGYDATPIRIGYNGHGPRAPAKTPPAVYVHKSNPLAGLALGQVAQIFTAGQPGGDVNLWSQLGLKGDWAARRIHAYGLADDGGFATGIRQGKLGGLPFALKYEALGSREAVLRAVAADPYGIALLGWVDAAKTTADVRVLPLAAQAGAPFYSTAYADVVRGLYPLSMPVQLYVNRAPGQPVDPLVKEYLRLTLSREGQAELSVQKDTEEGYIPLSPADLQQELRKLEAL
jgi:phosphate transport system substrate-binding protein